MTRNLPLCFALILSVLFSCNPASENLRSDEFLCPPPEFHVDTWWHWNGTNISREGIRKDLEAMHEAGIRRATIFTVNSTCKIVPPVEFASEEWFSHFRYALEVADSLGMKIGVHNCPGWSTAGGPWISEEQSIKMYVWSCTTVEGGQKIDTVLAEPQKNGNYYQDDFVIACPSGRDGAALRRAKPEVLRPEGCVSGFFADGNLKSGIALKSGESLILKYDEPFEAEKISFSRFIEFNWYAFEEAQCSFKLLCSDDGKVFREVCPIRKMGANVLHTVTIPPTTARYYKLEAEGSNVFLGEMELLAKDESPAYDPAVRNYIPRFYNSAGYHASDYSPSYAPGATAVRGADIIDLTSKMRPDGHLVWDAPQGVWDIIRFGMTGSGIKNAPADPQATGLESDKMDPQATEYHFRSFIGKCIETAGEYTGNVFSFVLVDSWECQFPNWTPAFAEEFRERRGYGIREWAPVMCGRLVESPEETERFIRDYQQTVGELIDENFYGKMLSLCHEAGLELHCEPIYGNLGLCYPGIDILKTTAQFDLPMSEFWARIRSGQERCYDSSHRRPALNNSLPIDGAFLADKKVIGAEAYTGNATFCDEPQKLRPFGDEAYCAGINDFILHSYVHQSLDAPSHLTLTERYANHFNRNNPWFTMCRSWLDYHARIQYILQKGETVTDALYYIGDTFPQCLQYEMTEKRLGEGYRAGAVNFESLDKVLKIGTLIIPDGVAIGSETLEKISKLEKKGVTVLRDKNGEMLKMPGDPDLKFEGSAEDPFMYIHKKIGGDDAYFVFNRTDDPVSGVLSFRVSGKKAEVWNPENGEIFAAKVSGQDGSRTSVDVSMQGHESMFFVFTKNSGAVAEPEVTAEETIIPSGPVRIDFDSRYDEGIPSVTVDSLRSLSSFSEERIRHFGGIATYTLKFDAPEGTQGKALKLSLGEMSAVAEITLNGEMVGSVWHSGGSIGIPALKQKDNCLQIRIGTTLGNRAIGDMVESGGFSHLLNGPGTDRIAKTDSSLSPSGLIGPLVIKVY